MCVPRLGTIVGSSASACSSSGRIRSAHTPVALITLSARTTNSSPSRRRGPGLRRRPVVARAAGHLEPVGADRTEPLGLAEHGQHEPRIVGLAVVEQVAAGRLARAERRQQLDDLLAGDHAVARRGSSRPRRPRRARRAARRPRSRGVAITSYMFSPIPTSRSGRAPPNAGTTSCSGVHEVRRQLDHQLALEQGLADEPEVELLQVAQPAVDELATTGCWCPTRSRPFRRARRCSRARPRPAPHRRR